MKKIFSIMFLLTFNFLKAQVSVVVQQPEMNLIYRDYDNILIPMAEGAEENRISAEGAIVITTNYNGKNGFIVRPGESKAVAIIHEAKINGQWQRFDTMFYKVKTFPSPRVKNYGLSKSSGANIQVGYPYGSPIQHKFEVVSMIIYLNGEIPIVGSVINPELVKKMKPGKRISGEAVVRNLNTGIQTKVSFQLKITL